MGIKTFASLRTFAILAAASACYTSSNGPNQDPSAGNEGTSKASTLSDGGTGVASDPEAGTRTGGAGGLPCDVSATLGAKCGSCHGATPAYGAPMSLVNYTDLTAQRNGQPVYALVKQRIHDDARPMPPPPNARLDASETAAIDAWVSAGAPQSDATCRSDVDAGTSANDPPPLNCTPDTFIRPGSAWTEPSGQTDSYVCYGFDVTVPSKRHVIGLAPKIDNKKIVHHLLLFQAPNSVSSTPAPCSIGGPSGGRLIAGWAPGGQNLELPPEAGFPESETTHWVLQVHYNNVSGKLDGEKDQSGFDLCTTDQLRANDADVMAPGSIKFTIPARSKLDLACDWKVSNMPDVHVFSTSPHMHKLGTALSTYVTPQSGGSPDKVVDVNFDFQTQLAYPITQVLKSGDTVTTHCKYTNSTDSDVSFGENTSDEMCFNFLAYYPKVNTPLWQWALPAAASKCTSTTQ